MNDKIKNLILGNKPVLIEKKGILCTTIIDMDTDPFDCRFEGENTVRIDFSGYDYITLSIKDLKQLIALIKKAETIYDSPK